MVERLGRDDTSQSLFPVSYFSDPHPRLLLSYLSVPYTRNRDSESFHTRPPNTLREFDGLSGFSVRTSPPLSPGIHLSTPPRGVCTREEIPGMRTIVLLVQRSSPTTGDDRSLVTSGVHRPFRNEGSVKTCNLPHSG